LFLVQSHVAALGGTCTVESQVGRGTTFIVRLPTRPAVSNQPADDAVAPVKSVGAAQPTEPATTAAGA